MARIIPSAAIKPKLAGRRTAGLTSRPPGKCAPWHPLFVDESYIVKALDAGARGYLFKDNADEDIERHPWSSRPRLVFSLAITRALLEDYARRMRKRGV